jgi:hypothetical protein
LAGTEIEDKPTLGTTGLTGQASKDLMKIADKARPVAFTEELFIKLLDRLAQGETLVAICADQTMPTRQSLFQKLYKDENARELYYAAREMQMEAMAEEILELSDNAENDWSTDDRGRRVANNDVLQRARLKVDTRKFIMAKMAPRRFGEKNFTEVSGDPNKPLTLTVVTGVPRSAFSLVRGDLPAPKILEGKVEKVDAPSEG